MSQPHGAEADLPKSPLEKIRLIHPGRANSQADIWLVKWRGETCVLRDYSGVRPRFWRWICRWAAAREVRAHRILEGIAGVPGLIEVLDGERYLIEFVDGEALNRTALHPDAGFFDQLKGTLQSMHARRVAHSDLRNSNILVGPGLTPHVIDLTTAWWGTSWWRLPLFWFLLRIDQRRFAISKARFCPESLDEAEKRLVNRRPLYVRIGRIYRKKIYPMLPLRRKPKDQPR